MYVHKVECKVLIWLGGNDTYRSYCMTLALGITQCGSETPYSLEAKHLIWVWIMKVKGPKNQADFIAQILKLFPSVLKTGAP